MRIATFLYPSNHPNFPADSLWQFNRILFSHLVEAYPHVEVLAVGPPDMPQLHPLIPNASVDLGVTKFQVRFGFPWGQLARVLTDFRPDVCFINMPEQASNFAVLAKDELGLRCKILNYVHYIPAGLTDGVEPQLVYEPSMNRQGNAQLMLMRILEGVAASDRTIICSRFGADLLRRMASSMLQHAELPDIAVMPPPFDPDEFDAMDDVPRKTTPQFAYNHRLYDEYGTHEIFALLTQVYEELGSRFEVLVTNPTAGRSTARAKLNAKLDENIGLVSRLPYVRLQHFNQRSDYYRALRACSAGIAPLKRHALWSMSVVDVLACGLPVIAFDIASFGELGITAPYLVSSPSSFKDAVRNVVEGANVFSQAHFRDIAHRYRGETAARNFVKIATEVA